ncbi:putative lactoylglutathione lyase [Ameyamaea chiangmaiensis NBRC 103196]|uniref:VOC family protein n=1 Tax=Ameyamaea chiangmaiensis TaxID=442969 RepID=A0A850PAD4_9PROT|nr:VOC family protein [Ameyamaea chiangmaiensis]MBS4075750.1 VOC family protein [Ameyamaea chiangmaiensis]NVN41004.1 VOC family protein [Ameyamaea chiangmaiensis]GBQ70295.1 putative lactoylglutathione lyase [Ameyamaea chiangmaiensis NBRC 103196]
MNRPHFVEIPARDLRAARAFYSAVFGWTFHAFGPSYAATQREGGEAVNIGLQGDPSEAPPVPLVVIEVPDLDASLSDVTQAGGVITKPIFSFPGGRRFHFRDPDGNELAACEVA